jgi:hypothetical protein
MSEDSVRVSRFAAGLRTVGAIEHVGQVVANDVVNDDLQPLVNAVMPVTRT